MTLEEAFLGKKPNVEHFRIFGCLVYIHIPKDKKKKQWKEAMTEEHQSIMKNDVWEIMPRPKDKSMVT
jgi:hypothetical protein